MKKCQKEIINKKLEKTLIQMKLTALNEINKLYSSGAQWNFFTWGNDEIESVTEQRDSRIQSILHSLRYESKELKRASALKSLSLDASPSKRKSKVQSK